MKILCLCPTFRRPALVANALACFLAQDHPDKFLMICDDSGEIEGRGANWEIVSYRERFPSLTAKYRAMYQLAVDGPICHDAVALMDDDDIYGPQWLSSHADALRDSRWSYPAQVWSTHAPPATSPTQPGLEPSSGRFWASAAVRRDLLAELGGFQEITRPTFDQEHLALWQHRGGPPGRPDQLAPPQYVYGWGRAPRHVSLEMGDHEKWYEQYARNLPSLFSGEPQELSPTMDSQTRGIYANAFDFL